MHSVMLPQNSDHPLPQRRHRKMLKDGSSEVWPQDAEDIFLDGLRDYWNSPWANFSRGRSRWRNQYLVDFLKKKGIDRSKKQVASHIQVLRNMWKGHPEFSLVAGPEELSEGSSTSDRPSPSRRSGQLSSRSSSRRRRSSVSTHHSSPPSTPPSYDSSEFSDSAVQPGSRRPPSLNISPLVSPQATPIKTEHVHTPHGSLFEPSGLPGVPEMTAEHSPLLMANRVAGLCLWAEGMEPNYIDVDALPFAGAPNSPGSPAAPPISPSHITLGDIVRTSLRVKLQMPADPNSSNAVGFSGAVAFASALAPSAEVMTRVHVDNECISREISPLIPVHDPAAATGAGAAMQARFVAMLPDSWLTRCRWLDTGGKKTIVTQQVVVDAEALFVAIYDLHRVCSAVPSAELVLWNKHMDNAPPSAPALLPLPMTPPSTSRFGSNAANTYLYSTAASLAGHAQHAHAHASHAQQHSHLGRHNVCSPALAHPISPVSAHAGSTMGSETATSGSNQTTPTHTSFPSLGSPTSPTAPSSSGSSAARSCVGFGQGMVTGAGVPMGHGYGGMGFGPDPWTTSLLPLF